MGYGRRASKEQLLACPFCKETFPADEHDTCPCCGLPLVPVDQLPVSEDEAEATKAQPIETRPEWQWLPATYWRRGRGPLIAAGSLGTILFFFPWVRVTAPEIMTLSGYEMAKEAGWIWAYLVAWVLMVPSVFSRRTIMQMRGARVVTSMFTAIPLLTIVILHYKIPKGGGLIPVRLAFQEPFYAAGVLALVTLPFALTFGGKMPQRPGERGSSADSSVDGAEED